MPVEMEYETFFGKGNVFLLSNFSDNGLTEIQTETCTAKESEGITDLDLE